MDSVRVLLTNLIDYAGLFPPAALPMDEAVENYSRYRQGRYNWALARFIVPAAALDQFASAMDAADVGRDSAPWRLSALAGPDLAADIARVLAFNNRHLNPDSSWAAAVDSIELKMGTEEQVRAAGLIMPGNLQLYAEVPLATVLGSLLHAAAESRARAKIRTGGTSPDLFPSVEVIANFLRVCSSFGVPFKATAGLHHPFRGNYPLTGDPRSPRALMHGFVNVFMAAAMVELGADSAIVASILDETSPGAFLFENSRLGWRDRWIDVPALLETRQQFALSFGSCSFEEPIEEMERLGLMG
jgi:hypothetical protein